MSHTAKRPRRSDWRINQRHRQREEGERAAYHARPQRRTSTLQKETRNDNPDAHGR
jgi:hypothetical protein